MTILIVIMKSCVPGMDPQIVKTRYWAEKSNRTNRQEIKQIEDEKINLLITVFKERKDHLENICSKYKAKYDSNWKTQRRVRDPRISKNPVLTKQEYYSAKDKRLNQKVVLTSHLLDNDRKVM